ncbi:MAG: phage virion morphogenesis protein [Verrucomicrobiales bacterium]|jgi:phage gpG-like protein|nr:phage virion morphogenesis protein [Verrucomicrobiales bacterium]
MSTEIKIEISPEAEALIKRLRDTSRLLPKAIAETLDRENELTVSAIQDERLSGKSSKGYENVGGDWQQKKAKRKGFQWRVVKLESLSGKQVLHVRSNLLRKSIRRSVATVNGSAIVSAIGSNVKYAAIHEYGGTTPAHVIRARNRKSLAFRFKGDLIFRRQVNHPGSKIPARPYIGPTIAERKTMYKTAIYATITQLLGQETP